MQLEIEVSQDFRAICEDIANEQKNLDAWAEVESDDMFQNGSFVGGFDASEMEFTFSFYDDSSKEWWFQLPLEKILELAEGGDTTIRCRAPS